MCIRDRRQAHQVRHLRRGPRGGRGTRPAPRPHHRHGALPPGERDAGRRASGLREALSAAEPGEFLTNDAGLLLAEVITVERRVATTFVGLDCGWNVMNDHRIYGRDLEYVVCGRADAPPAPVSYTH